MPNPTAPAAAPIRNGRIKGNAHIAGSGLGVVVAWGWNGFVTEPVMGPEVAIGVAVLLGQLARWGVAWLPEPSHGEEKPS